ncbi:MAG: fasciclin domain-containing protein [Actinomycetota bacterium]|nr:MAG: fasciclin domain-containing protein [Actinomycetota bacterium]
MSCNHRRTRHAAVTGIAVAGVLGLAACGSAAAPTANPPASSMPPSSMPATAMPSTSMPPAGTSMPSGGAASQVFGAGCAAVPATGSGSFTGMATDPVATAASHNPLLSTLVSAVTSAGLGDSLNSAQGITVFAPVNDAFAAMPKATLDKAMADPKGLLTKVLTYHVVPQRLAPAQLAGTHKTLEGASLQVTGSGTAFTVDGTAKVVCGNVPTANATVYLIDGVLSPKG